MCGDLSDKPGAPSKTFGLPKFRSGKTFGLPKFRSGVWVFGEALALSFLVNAVLHAVLPAVPDAMLAKFFKHPDSGESSFLSTPKLILTLTFKCFSYPPPLKTGGERRKKKHTREFKHESQTKCSLNIAHVQNLLFALRASHLHKKKGRPIWTYADYYWGVNKT